MARISKDNYYLGIALAVSKRSTCLKRHYGCVIVNHDEIVATGYNGSPRGESNCCDIGICKREDSERYSNYTECRSVHAEQNALISASRKEVYGGTAYLACESFNQTSQDPWDKYYFTKWLVDDKPVPCPICERMLRNAGIKRVVNSNGETIWE
ncbi:cytidine deaminase [Clostridium sp.]|uniref:deoxycytidylate deaminase n=1 Tax=Clostridium sp. TaxID=1506 RepID=UPI001A60DCCE|nr:cytidine deaminase [Clostridium sp.]MBK5234080.1 cytidine deaminase [Clostridium sp.]